MNTLVDQLEKYRIDPARVTGQRVLLRADLNVPLQNGTILDDFRLVSILPTIHLLQQCGARIVLATHIDRPAGKFDPALSTQHLIAWFNHHDYQIIFCPNLEQIPLLDYGAEVIFLLENLRFWPEEENGDEFFAQKLAQWGSCYINDAFAVSHRNDTSLTQVPRLFPKHKRFVGPLLLHEIAYLSPLIDNPSHPFVALIGGGKIESKLPLLQSLLPTVDTILLCPTISLAALTLFGKKSGKFHVDPNTSRQVKNFFTQATTQKVSIILPLDYQIAHHTIEGPLSIVDADAIPDNSYVVSIGPKTLEAWSSLIKQAKTIFFNAAIGFFEYPETLKGLHVLLQLIEQSPAYTVIAGGDSVAAARYFNLSSAFNYLSTGGGASLTFLAQLPLPGLAPFMQLPE